MKFKLGDRVLIAGDFSDTIGTIIYISGTDYDEQLLESVNLNDYEYFLQIGLTKIEKE